MSRLRLVNRGAEDAAVTIEGTDDSGESPGTAVRLTVPARGARTVTARELESEEARGESARDLDGALGDGAGKWRLAVTADRDIDVMSLLASPTGHLTNLSTAPGGTSTDDGQVVHHLPWFAPASDPLGRQSFARIINESDVAGEVRIVAFDDAGERYGPLTLTLDANETVHINSDDLERGNAGKGLDGETGEGEGRWRLALTSDLDLEVLGYLRTEDGFVTSVHDLAPRTEAGHHVVFFNPGGNTSQVSRLRLVNRGAEERRGHHRGHRRLRRVAGDGGAPHGAGAGGAHGDRPGAGVRGRARGVRPGPRRGARRRGRQVAAGGDGGPGHRRDEPAREPHRAPHQSLHRSRRDRTLSRAGAGRKLARQLDLETEHDELERREREALRRDLERLLGEVAAPRTVREAFAGLGPPGDAGLCRFIETLHAEREALGTAGFDALLGRTRQAMRRSLDRGQLEAEVGEACRDAIRLFNQIVPHIEWSGEMSIGEAPNGWRTRQRRNGTRAATRYHSSRKAMPAPEANVRSGGSTVERFPGHPARDTSGLLPPLADCRACALRIGVARRLRPGQ